MGGREGDGAGGHSGGGLGEGQYPQVNRQYVFAGGQVVQTVRIPAQSMLPWSEQSVLSDALLVETGAVPIPGNAASLGGCAICAKEAPNLEGI
eukprot:6199388-Pleurochrysis_carterae.AAC.1